MHMRTVVFCVCASPPLSLTGNGILIGLIDTGIRYTFPDFLKEDGTTKPHSVWDQTQQSGQTPIGLPYGTVFSKKKRSMKICVSAKMPRVYRSY